MKNIKIKDVCVITSKKIFKKWWAEQGSNLRPPPRQGDVIPLDHRPKHHIIPLMDRIKITGLEQVLLNQFSP